MDTEVNEDAEVGVQKIVDNFNLINKVQRKLEILEKSESSRQVIKDQTRTLKTKEQLEDLLLQLETVEEVNSALRESKKRVHEEIMKRKNCIDSSLSRRRSGSDIEALLGISASRRSFDIEPEVGRGLSRRSSSFGIDYEARRRRNCHIESEPGRPDILVKSSHPTTTSTSKHGQRRVHFIDTDHTDRKNANRSTSRLQSEKAPDCFKAKRTSDSISMDSKQARSTGQCAGTNATFRRMKGSYVPEITQESEGETEECPHVNGEKKRLSRAQNKKKGHEEAELERHKHPYINGGLKKSPPRDGGSKKSPPRGQGRKNKNFAHRLSKVFVTCFACGFALYLCRSFGECVVCQSKKAKKLKHRERLESNV